MNWERKAPEAEGIYLRLNAGGGISRHDVRMENGVLVTQWGWGGHSRIDSGRREAVVRQMSGFFWYGPIPFPPADEERYVKPQEATSE